MKRSTRIAAATIAVGMIGAAVVFSAHAGPLIANGGFESGFTSWTRVDQVGSDGSFILQSGTSSPVNGDPVPAPPEGTTAAMSDAQGPGAHVLYQDFVVPTGGAILSFDLFIGNRSFDFFTPATLAFATPALNQQARVDIVIPSLDPFSLSAADILLNVYQTNVGDALISGYATHATDLSALFAAHVGETLRLRFAETDNVFIFQLGVDNVSINASSVPEPAPTLLLGAALAALLVSRSGIRSARTPS